MPNQHSPRQRNPRRLVRGGRFAGSSPQVRCDSLAGFGRPLSESITRFAAASGETILIEDARSDPRLNQALVADLGERSHICVPFFSGGEIVTVAVDNVDQSHETNVTMLAGYEIDLAGDL